MRFAILFDAKGKKRKTLVFEKLIASFLSTNNLKIVLFENKLIQTNLK